MYLKCIQNELKILSKNSQKTIKNKVKGHENLKLAFYRAEMHKKRLIGQLLWTEMASFFSNVLFSTLKPTVTRSTSYYMEQGHWFLSVYNDDMDAQEVSFVLRVSQELTKNCPNGCNGRGQCILGRCQCEQGYDGPDCGQSKFFFIPDNFSRGLF